MLSRSGKEKVLYKIKNRRERKMKVEKNEGKNGEKKVDKGRKNNWIMKEKGKKKKNPHCMYI